MNVITPIVTTHITAVTDGGRRVATVNSAISTPIPALGNSP